MTQLLVVDDKDTTLYSKVAISCESCFKVCPPRTQLLRLGGLKNLNKPLMGCVKSLMRGPETESYDDSIATFEKLQISKSSVEKLRKIFNKIDADGSGQIDYAEFVNHFGFKRSRFTKRAFSVMDEDGSGEVDFQEFVLCVWNYCTFNKPALMRFAFELYDEDNSGLIDADELLLMLKELTANRIIKKI